MKRVLVCIVLLLCGLIINAQSRLYPSARRNYSSILKDHYQRVDSLLLNGGDFNDFAFEIRPSFSGESGCWYDSKDSVLVLRTASKSIWYTFSSHTSTKNNNRFNDFVVTEYRCHFSPEAIQKLRNLFIAATFSSSYLAQPLGADGVTYQIYIRGGMFTAECWSPNDKNSNCGKLAAILTHLKTAIINNNPKDIDDLIPMVESLTQKFEDLYPEDVKDDNMWLSWLTD